MWAFIPSILLVLYWVSPTTSHLFLHHTTKDFLDVSTPEEYALQLQDRLFRNETKFVSKKCLQSLREYSKSLLNGELWALKMFDARAKLPSGFFRVNGGSLGAFDQCLSIQTQNAKLGTIRGKYCLGMLQIFDMRKERMQESETEEKILNLAKVTYSLPWASCLPDACSPRDFRFLHFFALRFPEENCQTKASQTIEFDGADLAALGFFGLIAGLMIVSTTYDAVIYYTQKGRGSILLRSFSVITNGSQIISYRENDTGITCLHGIRAMTLFFLTAGYRFFVHLFAPLNNWLDMGRWFVDTAGFLEGAVILDTFFVITGMLISYNYLKFKAKKGGFNLLAYYLKRVIRLTPALAAIILVHSTLLRHMGSGPVWPSTRDSLLVNNCRKHWWSALLYVQNYVNPGLTEICVLQSWQLAVDMQLYILSPLLLISLTRAPRYTLSAIGCLLFCAITSAFLTGWVYELKSVIITVRSLAEISQYIRKFFFPTHTRASSWIIGFVLGYVIYETKRTQLKIPVKKELLGLIVTSLWVASFSLMIMCVWIGGEFSGKKYNWVAHAFHMALVRPIWCLSISWIIFACVHGYGGLINSFLSLPVFQVISRISYGTYLTNFALIFFLTYQTRVGLEFSNFHAIYKCCGDVVFCLALGFVWTIAFESPMITIWKVAVGQLRTQTKEDSGIKIIYINSTGS